MRVALSAGADPHVIMNLDIQQQPCTLVAYVELFVRPKYPAEADDIMNAIQKAKSRRSHHKKSIKGTSINIVNFQQATTDGVVIVKPKKRRWWKRAF
jgi:capsular polysaccharide biosynthesis protein